MLDRVEQVVDASAVADKIEARLPVGVRPRQLLVRTLLVGMLLALKDGRPAHLTRVAKVLASLSEPDQLRLGVVTEWKRGRHLLTYRQIERTYGLVCAALKKDEPDGTPSAMLSDVSDALVEASVPDELTHQTTALAIDWTDLETYSRPPSPNDLDCADKEASWGHRSGAAPGQKDELFFGYFLSVATMVKEEDGQIVPEIARAISLTTCAKDPVQAFVPVMQRLHASGHAIGDVLADSGYAHRTAANFALPLRALGAQLVLDLHPHDRGEKGTFAGAIASNGNLYCPATPKALLELSPVARDALPEKITAHDHMASELSRYKLGAITTDDQDGYHRVMCPAAMAKLRCPLRPDSMTASYAKPEVLAPPQQPPACCTQRTVTVPVEVNAKTRQKHDYPSKAHRISYARRTGSERTFSTVKDPATNDIARGWCRLMGVAAITLFLACLFVARNQRILDAFEERRADEARRLAAGMPPRTRRRRRKTLSDLAGLAAANAPP
ncbi:MAG: hypothetical protein ACRDKB_12465 [Actinomycetota bacterium]